MSGSAEHDHVDPLRLTTGCPGCTERVRADQFAANLRSMDTADICDLVWRLDQDAMRCAGSPLVDLADAELTRRWRAR